MRKMLSAVLMALSLSAWADCPDENTDLPDKLSKPMRKGSEIIAVVKGTLGTEVDEDGFLVSTVYVTHSYGLAISAGKYLISNLSYWGQRCLFYDERPRRPGGIELEKNTTIYFAISRFHGRTLVTPENEEHGLFLVNSNIHYEGQDGSKSHIKQTLFEHYVLTGVPKKFWLLGDP
ncbi:hypothetical protein [Pseudomonas fluorescens]|uniref:Lipoprotein n=1 Tax=Pseudomonas fluorescens TaxID=294 RepID=A0A5E7P4Y1_PSEFL|nr:hypothetical protein [Pseudomonas fluorescens]VVP44816.1 hypothetical protein PS880_05038 [Pseudomonas fluorescens]